MEIFIIKCIRWIATMIGLSFLLAVAGLSPAQIGKLLLFIIGFPFIAFGFSKLLKTGDNSEAEERMRKRLEELKKKNNKTD